MRGVCVCKVLASSSPSFNAGDYVTGTVGWTEVAIAPAEALQKVEVPANGRVTDALGVLGMTGLTAYQGESCAEFHSISF